MEIHYFLLCGLRKWKWMWNWMFVVFSFFFLSFFLKQTSVKRLNKLNCQILVITHLPVWSMEIGSTGCAYYVNTIYSVSMTLYPGEPKLQQNYSLQKKKREIRLTKLHLGTITKYNTALTGVLNSIWGIHELFCRCCGLH